MAERSTRSRLGQSGGDKSMADLLAAGAHYEGIRAAWFAQFGQWQRSEECLGRQRYFEREWSEEVGVPING